MQQDMADGQTKALIQDPRGSYTEDGGGQRNFLRLIEFLISSHRIQSITS